MTEREDRLALADEPFEQSVEVQTDYERGREDGIKYMRGLADEVLARTIAAELENSPVMEGMREALREARLHLVSNRALKADRAIARALAALSAPHPQARGEESDAIVRTAAGEPVDALIAMTDGKRRTFVEPPLPARPSEATAGREALALVGEAKELLAVAYKGGSYKSKINSAMWRLTYAERALALPASRNGVDTDGANRK